MFRVSKDRIGTHYRLSFGSWFALSIVLDRKAWAGSCWAFRKRLWLRPIDYTRMGVN